MVMEYASLTGNCRRCKMNGKLASDGANFIHGINTVFLLTDIVSTTMIFSYNSFTVNLVPLHTPLCISRFLRSTMIGPTFRQSRCSGIPDGVKLFINSRE